MAVAAAEPRKTSTDGRTERLPFGAGREVHVVQTPRRMSSPNPEIAYVNASRLMLAIHLRQEALDFQSTSTTKRGSLSRQGTNQTSAEHESIPTEKSHSPSYQVEQST